MPPRAVSGEVVPNGARITYDDGSTKFLTGSGAQALATRLSPQMGVATQPVMSVATQPVAALPPPDVRQGQPVEWQGPPTPAAPPPPQPSAGVGPEVTSLASPGLPADPVRAAIAAQAARAALRGSYQPGRNPARELEQGVMVPKGGSVGREGGLDPADTKVLLEARGAAVAEASAAQEAGFAEQASVARARQAEAEAAIPQYQQQAALEQAKIRTIQARHDQYMGELQQDMDRAYARKVDPDQAFAGNTGAAIAGLLGMIVGGFQQGSGRGPNIAWEAVQQKIAQSVRIQEQDINAGKERAHNMLALYRDKYGGDMDLARAGMKATLEALATAQANRLVAATKRADIAQQFAQWKAQTALQNVDWARDFAEKARGKVTEQVNQEFAQPRAGGYVQTLDQMMKAGKAWEWATGGDFSRLAAEEEAKARGKAAGSPTGTMTPKGFDKTLENYFKVRATKAPADLKIEGIARAAGLVQGEDGLWHKPAGVDLAGAGILGGRTRDLSEKGRYINQALGMAIDLYRKDITGAAAAEKELKMIESRIRGNLETEDEFVNGLNLMQSGINEDLRQAGEAAGPEVLQEANRRITAVRGARSREGERFGPRVSPPNPLQPNVLSPAPVR